jgi:transposase, IS30 family
VSVHTQEQFDAIADCLNSRPRATHHWLVPMNPICQFIDSRYTSDLKLSLTNATERHIECAA